MIIIRIFFLVVFCTALIDNISAQNKPAKADDSLSNYIVDSLQIELSDDNIIDDKLVSGKVDTLQSLPIVFPNDFIKDYDNVDYQYIQTENRNYIKEFKRWLTDMIKRLLNLESSKTAGVIVEYIIKIAYFVILSIIFYFILKSIFKKEGRWLFKKSLKSITINEDITNDALEAEQIDKKIEQFKNELNYRYAIRYYFIWLLQILNNKEIIKLEKDKTASQYALEIKDKKLLKDYNYARYLYNHIWFGEFEVDQQSFELAENSFKSIINEA